MSLLQLHHNFKVQWEQEILMVMHLRDVAALITSFQQGAKEV